MLSEQIANAERNANVVADAVTATPEPKRLRYGGREKGTPNKIGADLRAMIERALQAAGGEEYLRQQAIDNPTAFMALVAKLLPRDVHLQADMAIEVRHLLIERAMSLMLGKPIPEQTAMLSLQDLAAPKVEPQPSDY